MANVEIVRLRTVYGKVCRIGHKAQRTNGLVYIRMHTNKTTRILPPDCTDDLADLALSVLKQHCVGSRKSNMRSLIFIHCILICHGVKKNCIARVSVRLFYLIKLQCLYWICPELE